MSHQSSNNLLSALGRQTRRLGRDLREFLVARWLLLEVELRETGAGLRRLVLLSVFVTIVFLSGWTLLLVAMSDMLDGLGGLSRAAWAGILGGSFVLMAIAGTIVALRWLRGTLRGLEQSLEELREDAAWIREWVGTDQATEPAAAGERSEGLHDDPG